MNICTDLINILGGSSKNSRNGSPSVPSDLSPGRECAVRSLPRGEFAWLAARQQWDKGSHAIFSLVMSSVPLVMLDMYSLKPHGRKEGIRDLGKAKDVVYRPMSLPQSSCEVFCFRNSSGLAFFTIKCKNCLSEWKKKKEGCFNEVMLNKIYISAHVLLSHWHTCWRIPNQAVLNVINFSNPVSEHQEYGQFSGS